jgi:hypothetical protein
MNGFDFLDLVIGLIFIYLIYSIAASTLWEIFVNAAHLKGNMLRKWITSNFKELNDPETGDNKILDHPMISLLHYPIIKGNPMTWFRKKDQKKPVSQGNKPTYISASTFTDVLVDLVTRDPEVPLGTIDVNINTFRNQLIQTKFLPDGLKSVFLGYINEASGSLQKAKDKIAAWYEEAQDRLIGSYKKNLQMWIFLISALLVVSTNADTFNLVSYLYNNDNAREALATKASLLVQDPAIVNLIERINTTKVDEAMQKDKQAIVEELKMDVARLDSLRAELQQDNIPIGWNQTELSVLKKMTDHKFVWYLKKIIGLLITILAVALGSPFWFDVLSKLSNLRSSGKKPEPSDEEKTKNETGEVTLRVSGKN